MSQESAGERRLALGEWYREGSKSLTQLSLKKITKKPVCSVCVIWIHFEFNPGRKKDKRERGKKKKKRRRKKSFLLQIKYCRY